MQFRWADEDPSQTDVVERMVTEAVVEHRKKITKLQKKLAAEKERRKYYGCVALLSWMIIPFGGIMCSENATSSKNESEMLGCVYVVWL